MKNENQFCGANVLKTIDERKALHHFKYLNIILAFQYSGY